MSRALGRDGVPEVRHCGLKHKSENKCHTAMVGTTEEE